MVGATAGVVMKHLANPWIHGLASYEAGEQIEEVARDFGFGDIDELVKILGDLTKTRLARRRRQSTR